MPVEKTGKLTDVGTVTYKSFDGYVTTSTFKLDSAKPPLLWRTMAIGQGNTETEGEACVSLETALGMLESYQKKFSNECSGDLAGIIKKISAAKPADPAEIIAKEKVQAAAAAEAADY